MNSGPGTRTSSGWLLGVFMLLLLSMTATLGYYLWSEFPELNERSVASNLGFFLLININIIVVMVLVFLVTKNIITLVLDRRKNILGSRLRARLVTAFVALSLVPTVLLFLVAKGILESVFSGWFSPQIATSVEGALNIAKFHSDSAQAELSREAKLIAGQLQDNLAGLAGPERTRVEPALQTVIQNLLRKKQTEFGLVSLTLLDRDSALIARSRIDTDTNPPDPNARAIQQAASGNVVVRPEYSLKSEFITAYVPVFDTASGTAAWPASYVLVGSQAIPARLGELLSGVINSYEDYNELRTYRRPLASSYLLTLVVVTLLIVFAAIWIGFYLAKSLSVPIGLLAKATAQVAHGNLDYQVPETGDDELSILVRSFNTMTSDLRNTTAELVARRRYMEAVFANVAVGVISVDRDLIIRAVNIAASEILELPDPQEIVHRSAEDVLPEELVKRVKELSVDLYSTATRTVESNVSLHAHEVLKHLRLTLTSLTDDEGKVLGSVMLFDDLTELVSAQRVAAWREVARRIAHEIKNPLTPIQLCAQRIQRRFTGKKDLALEPADLDLVTEATDIIVDQVESLRNLVNEFSRFARMPKSTLHQGNLNELLGDTLAIYRQAHPEIQFSFHVALDLPAIEFDREQMGRALINLLDNAVASVMAARDPAASDSSPIGEISLQSSYESGLGLATILVSDTGVGIKEKDKERLFEPYFSTKHGGTGLGLAIASAIVADHNGFIRVRDNKPRGAIFVIELPVSAAGSVKRAVNEI